MTFAESVTVCCVCTVNRVNVMSMNEWMEFRDGDLLAYMNVPWSGGARDGLVV